MINSMSWVALVLYVLLKPFYLFPSGGLQIADILLLLSAGLVFVDAIKDRKHVKFQRIKNLLLEHKFFIIFIITAIAINSLYFFFSLSYDYAISSAQLMFVVVGLLLFLYHIETNSFRITLLKALVLTVGVQFFIYALGLGAYYGTTEPRYMGTFNDPNQLGFYLVLSYALVYILTRGSTNGRRIELTTLAICFFLTLESASTGMMVFWVIFFILRFMYILYNSKSKLAIKRAIPIALFIVILPLSFFAISSSGIVSKGSSSAFHDMLGRISQKIDRLRGEGSVSIIEDRCIDKVSENSTALVYGSGDGQHERFPTEYCKRNEVHSTFVGLLFYYGIVPFVALTVWCIRMLKGVSFEGLVVVIPLLLESFTLANHRQVYFWLIISMAGYSYSRLTLGRRNTEFIDKDTTKRRIL